jgi:hypothetical protein
MRRSRKTAIFNITVLATQNHTLPMQAHSGAGILKLGEHDFHLHQCSDWRHYVREYIDPGSIDVTSDPLAALQLPVLGFPYEERWHSHSVAFGFSQFNGIENLHFSSLQP